MGIPRDFLTWAEASCVAGFPKEVTAELSEAVGWGVGRRGRSKAWFNEDRVEVSLIGLQRNVVSKLFVRADAFTTLVSPSFSARPGSQQSTGFAVVCLGLG